MSKRTADDEPSTSGASNPSEPPLKKVLFEPYLIGPVSSLEEMDMKVLEFRNKRLAERIEQRIRVEAELRHRIEQLEKRQTRNDVALNTFNRYWNQFNEDIGVLVQRLDAETADEVENKNENEVTTSFVTQLSSWDKEELDETLSKRVQMSKQAIAKIVQVIDRLLQRNENIAVALQDVSGAYAASGDGNEDDSDGMLQIDETLTQTQLEITAENRNLQNLNTSLHEKFHTISLKSKEYQDALAAKETENAELKNQIEGLQCKIEKVHCRNDKLENHLAQAIEKLKAYYEMYDDLNKSSASTAVKVKKVGANVSKQDFEEVQKELDKYREMAHKRLQALDKLRCANRGALKEIQQLKKDMQQLPESVVVETTKYKSLQSQVSVLHNESKQMKIMLEKTRKQLQISENLRLRHIVALDRSKEGAQ